MEATIFKNDDFETVGFKVMHKDVMLFRWGSTTGYNTYSKTINVEKYTAQVLELIQLDKMVEYYEHDYVRQSFDVLMHDNADRWEGSQFAEKGINFKKIDDTKKQMEERMIRVIEFIVNNK